MKKLISLAALASVLGMIPACSKPQTTTASAAPEIASQVTTLDEVPAGQKLVQAPQTATLRVKFVIDGKPPAPNKIDASRDAYCAALDIQPDELIIGKDGAIKNVVFYLDEKNFDGEIPAALKVAPKVVHKLDNKNCMFEPAVLFVRPGQSIDVLNSDQTGHNANFSFFKNDPVNFLIPIGGSKLIENIEYAESGVAQVECNIHPWMKAHIFVTDHPFVGISDEDGVLEITDLPPGKMPLRVWHKIGKLDEVTIDGKKEKWSKNRLEFELKPGMNDLGVIKVAAEKFESR